MSQSISGRPVLGFWYSKSYNYIKCSPLIAFFFFFNLPSPLVFQFRLLLKWTFRWGLLPDISILFQDDKGFIIVLFSFKLNINPLILSLCRIRWFLSRHTPKYSSNVRHSSTWLSIIQHCRIVYRENDLELFWSMYKTNRNGTNTEFVDQYIYKIIRECKITPFS